MKTVLAVAVLCGLAAACSSSSSSSAPATVSEQEAVQQFMPIYCSKMKDCFADGFATAYPGGVDDCTKKAMSSQTAAQLAAPSACSQAEIDTCTKDVSMMACAASADQMAVPASCTKC